MEQEGVIKFRAEHVGDDRWVRRHSALTAKLSGWRTVLAGLRVVGQDDRRYEGAGFGNLSARVGPPSSSMGRRAMLITGSQTGGIRQLSLRHYCVVDRYDVRQNRVWSSGLVMPSSESLTHAAMYDLSPEIRFVFHAHAPAIWHRAHALRIPTTRVDVAYGTVDMAYEVQRLYRETGLAEGKLLAMGGHEDGVIAFGHTADEAGQRLVGALAQAFEDEALADRN